MVADFFFFALNWQKWYDLVTCIGDKDCNSDDPSREQWMVLSE